MVYGRALFSGRELGEKGEVASACRESESQRRGKEKDHPRIDETSKIANCVSQIHPGYHSRESRRVFKLVVRRIASHNKERSNLVPSARRTCTLVVGFVWSTEKRVLALSCACSRGRDATGTGGAGADATIEEEETSAPGKAPGIPICGARADEGATGSGTTPPSRLPEPAKPRRGVET